MFHPLLENPTRLKDQELENKILDLTRKYHIAASMGQRQICQQVVIILETLKEEQNKRQQETMKSVMKKQNKDLDDLINVD
jgi:hypothetical protein